jgi:hypothetical protein
VSVTINSANFNAGKRKKERREIENFRVGEGVQGKGGTGDRCGGPATASRSPAGRGPSDAVGRPRSVGPGRSGGLDGRDGSADRSGGLDRSRWRPSIGPDHPGRSMADVTASDRHRTDPVGWPIGRPGRPLKRARPSSFLSSLVGESVVVVCAMLAAPLRVSLIQGAIFLQFFAAVVGDDAEGRTP